MTKEAKDFTQQTCVKKKTKLTSGDYCSQSTREVDSGLVLIPTPENRDTNMNVKCLFAGNSIQFGKAIFRCVLL